MRPFLLLLLSVTAAQTPAAAQTPPDQRAEVLILGSFHMANPGHDINNIQADDVLSPQRQQQIAELMAVLKKFNPTKIAIEANVGTEKRPQQYADYLAGKYELSRNEIDQIGFRLAKELGHKQIYCVDADGDFPYMRIVNYAKANNLTAQLDAITRQGQEQAKESGDFLKSHTILEMLEHVNADEHVAQDLSWYYKVLRLGDPWEYAGPELWASWFQRNIRIYSNIIKLADAPSGDTSGGPKSVDAPRPADPNAAQNNAPPERILVIFGYGHLAWLRQLAANDPNVRLRKLGEFAK